MKTLLESFGLGLFVILGVPFAITAFVVPYGYLLRRKKRSVIEIAKWNHICVSSLLVAAISVLLFNGQWYRCVFFGITSIAFVWYFIVDMCRKDNAQIRLQVFREVCCALFAMFVLFCVFRYAGNVNTNNVEEWERP